MQYQVVRGQNGERLLLPILAGAAIISAPFWFNNNNNKCCNNNQNFVPAYYPYPVYPQGYYPYPNNYQYPQYQFYPPSTQINYN